METEKTDMKDRKGERMAPSITHSVYEKHTIRFVPDEKKDIKIYHSVAYQTFVMLKYNVEKEAFYLYIGDANGCGEWYIPISKDDAMDFILREGNEEDYLKMEKYF